MPIVRDSLPWTPTDSEQLRFFLETPTGQRLLPKLAEASPGLLSAGDTNSILIRSGEVRGVQMTLAACLALANPSDDVVKAPDSYPPLDDDTAWQDKQLH